MKHIENFRASFRAFLGGKPMPPLNRWIFRLEIFWLQIEIFFSELFRRGKPGKGGDWGFPPFGGKLAPIRPSPRSYLMAARAMPPSDHTYLLRKR
jgi:hypothetical protein